MPYQDGIFNHTGPPAGSMSPRSARGLGGARRALRARARAAVAVFVEAVAGGAVGAAAGGGGGPGCRLVDVAAQRRFADYRLAVGRGRRAALIPGAAEGDLVGRGAGFGGEVHVGGEEAVHVVDVGAGGEVDAGAGAFSRRQVMDLAAVDHHHGAAEDEVGVALDEAVLD